MERGEIWIVSREPVLGREQQGKRPVLIISPKAFNDITGAPIILPVTTGGNFARVQGFAVSLSGVGTETTGMVRCDQPRALNLKALHAKRLEKLPIEIIDDVLARVNAIFSNS